MQVFVRIAERGSFSQAAEDLQIPRATVTNLIKRMEKRLGARLLEPLRAPVGRPGRGRGRVPEHRAQGTAARERPGHAGQVFRNAGAAGFS
ncbi:hypothetical protein G6F65_018595 [Rhizopus arrhizus]|nr:hypothetical protein G6F65_018595 [Rhizopus arrhizus]